MNFLILSAVLAAGPMMELNAPGSEVQHSAAIAHELGGLAEVRLPDNTRCDVVTDTHAIEVEWAEKWAEAPGQATLYSIWLGKRPAIYLLVDSMLQDQADILRCRLVCERLKIKLVIVRVPANDDSAIALPAITVDTDTLEVIE